MRMRKSGVVASSARLWLPVASLTLLPQTGQLHMDVLKLAKDTWQAAGLHDLCPECDDA